MKKTMEESENPAESQTTSPEEPTSPANDSSAQIAELINDLKRTRADFENYRKQTDLQKSQAIQAARDLTVQKFLPLVDDFYRAISAYPEQLKPLEKSFQKTLQTLGLSIIDSIPGTEFNPDFHEAVSTEEGEGDIEIILETLRPGYLYDGNVVRAAMVKVGHTDKKA